MAGLVGGGYVVTWARTVGANTEIHFQRVNAAGTLVGGDVTLDSAGTINDQPEIVALQDGGFAIAYRKQRVRRRRRHRNRPQHPLNADGSPRASLFVDTGVQGTGTNQNDTTITEMSNGFIAVGWTNDSGVPASRTTDVAFYNPSGAFQANLTGQISSSDQLALAGLAGGRFVTMWRDVSAAGDGSGTEVRAAVFDLIRNSTGDGADDVILGDDLHDNMIDGGGNDILSGGTTNPPPPSARSAPGTHAAARSSVPEAKPRAPHARPAQAGPLSHQETCLMTNS